MVSPRILLISSTLDFSTDYIAVGLGQLGVPFVRLNRDTLADSEINFFPTKRTLEYRSKQLRFSISDSKLKAVYYRAPTFLRELGNQNLTLNEKLVVSQWATFCRALSVFEKAKWINWPAATYLAEIKPYQLSMAEKIGFKIPNTIITNNQTAAKKIKSKTIAVKSLDTIVVSGKNKTGFFYTTEFKKTELSKFAMQKTPVIIQSFLKEKIDIRVTVVGKKIFSVKILCDGFGVEGDWRLKKANLRYIPFDLPNDIKRKCFALTKRLGLVFGAIDFVLVKGKYYFLEINPTGEWSWLLDTAKLPIDSAIIRELTL